MSDRDYLLVAAAHLAHNERHLLSDFTANTCVYLVENNGWKFNGTAYHCFKREHDTSYFATRRYLLYGLQRTVAIGRKEKLHFVGTIGSKRFGMPMGTSLSFISF